MIFFSALLELRQAAIFEWGTVLYSLSLEIKRNVVARQRHGTVTIFDSGTAVYHFRM